MSLLRKFVEGQSANEVRHLTPVVPKDAVGLVADVYQQLRRDFMVVPPFTLHSPCPDLLAATWAIGRETLVAGSLERVGKEAIAAAVSERNGCPYCVDVHTMSRDLASAQSLSPEHQAWASWALGPAREPSFDAPPALIGTAVCFHYINRMVHVFLGDDAMPGPALLRGAARWMAKPMMRELTRRTIRAPGESLQLFPDPQLLDSQSPNSQLPADLAWAATDPAIAGAFARMAAVTEDLATHFVAEPVMHCVRERLSKWDGSAAGLDGAWINDELERLAEPDRAAGRLALLTAFASYRVTDEVVQDYVGARDNPDHHVLALTAWASFAAARRIGTLLTPPPA